MHDGEQRPLLHVAMMIDVVGVFRGLEVTEGLEARGRAVLGTCVRVRQAEMGATAVEEGTVDKAAPV